MSHRLSITLGIVILAALACGPLAAPSAGATTSPLRTPAPSPSASATLFTTPPTNTPYPTVTPGPSPTIPMPTQFPAEYYVTPGPNIPSAILQIGRGQVTAMDLSPDGVYVAVGTAFGIHLYRASNFEEIWFQPTWNPVSSLAISPDGRQIAYITSTGEVDFLPLDNPAVLQGGFTVDGEYPTLSWSPDGKQISVGTYSPTQVIILDVETGEQLHLFHTWRQALWSPDGGSIVLSQEDSACVVDARSGALRYNLPITGLAVAWSPDSLRLYAGSRGFSTMLDAATGNTLVQMLGDIESPRSAVWSRDGRLVAATDGLWEGSRMSTIVWDTNTGQQVFQQLTGVAILRFAPDNTLYMAWPDTVSAWDIHSGKMLRRLEGFSGYNHPPIKVSWSPDGRSIALASDYSVVVWDYYSHQQTASANLDFIPDAPTWSADGSRIFISGINLGYGARALVMNAWTLEPIHQAQSTDYIRIVWLPDGQRYLLGTFLFPETANPKLAHLLLFNAGSDKPVWNRQVLDLPFDATLSPDGQLVALSSNTIVQIRDAATGGEVTQLPDQPSQVDHIVWLPDNRRAVLALHNGTLALWNITTGKQVRRYDRTGSLPTISPDGARMALALDDDSIQVISIDSGQSSTTLRGHKDAITAMAWSPDGTMLASTSGDGTMIIWKLP